VTRAERVASWLAGFSVLVLSVLLAWCAVSDTSNLWVQSDYAIHLVRSTRNGVAIQPLSDLLNTVATTAGFDQRARFLGYFVIAIDQKIRLMLYRLGVVSPAFNPVLWILHGVVGPVLLFRFLVSATGSFVASCVGLAAYLSSAGFLYVFVMNWLPHKAIVALTFIVTLWMGDRIDRRLARGQLFFSGPKAGGVAVLLVMLTGFLADESGFLAPALLVTAFWWRFVPGTQQSLPDAAKNALLLLAPFGAFVVLVLLVVPRVAEDAFNMRFDYLATLTIGWRRAALSLGDSWPVEVITVPTLNLVNFIGVSLLPYRLTGLTISFPPHYGIQAMGVMHLIMLVVCATVGIQAVRSCVSDQAGAAQRRLLPGLLSVVVVVVGISVLRLSHVPRLLNGFYYGSPIAVTLALLVAYTVRCSTGAWRACLVSLGVWIVLTQFQNFLFLDRIWSAGGDASVATLYMPYLPISGSGRAWTYQELRTMLKAAETGKLDQHLDRKGVSPRLFYVVAEQCVAARSVSRRCDPLLAFLAGLSGSPGG
jgi:hypothetical protein